MKNDVQATPAWWQFGHVWLIAAGPIVVIVASFITLYLAITRPDPVVTADPVGVGRKSVLQVVGEAAVPPVGAMAPAIQGRNHAATGVREKSVAGSSGNN